MARFNLGNFCNTFKTRLLFSQVGSQRSRVVDARVHVVPDDHVHDRVDGGGQRDDQLEAVQDHQAS